MGGVIYKKQKDSVIPSESNSERLTRKRLIDPKLNAAGWKIVTKFTAEISVDRVYE
jgi:type I site-specific restriction endonuclease